MKLCPDCLREMEEKPKKYICWHCSKLIPKHLTVGDMFKDTSVLDPRKD